jgi:Uncharacterized protein conserved in bacteria
MEWEKAKNIVIALFLALNIFLFYNLVQEKWVPAASGEQISAIEDVLKERGTVLNTKIPATSGNFSKLAFQGVAEFDTKKVYSMLLGTDKGVNTDGNLLINGDKQISIENKYTFLYTNKSPKEEVNLDNTKEIEKYLLKFLSQTSLSTDDLAIDNYDRQTESVRITLVQKKGKYKLFENKIEAEVTKNGVSRLWCSLQKASSQNKEDSIMPVYRIMMKNLGQLDGMVISSIDLGYTMSEGNNQMTGYTERLYWRIEIEGKDPVFYDAVNGELKKG